MKCSMRETTAEDLPFIFNSWLKSFRFNEDASRMSNGVYFGYFKELVTGLLESSSIVVACNPDDSTQIYGYAVYDHKEDIDLFVLHYIYVKYPFRNLGIGKRILETVHKELGIEPFVCTFASRVFDNLKEQYLITYNPFLRG